MYSTSASITWDSTVALSSGMRPLCSSQPTKPHSMNSLKEAPMVADSTLRSTHASHSPPGHRGQHAFKTKQHYHREDCRMTLADTDASIGQQAASPCMLHLPGVLACCCPTLALPISGRLGGAGGMSTEMLGNAATATVLAVQVWQQLLSQRGTPVCDACSFRVRCNRVLQKGLLTPFNEHAIMHGHPDVLEVPASL